MAIDINSVSPEELTEAAGIKPEIALAICEYRDDNGGFMDLDEVGDIPGVDEMSMEQLRKAGVKVSTGAEADGSM